MTPYHTAAELRILSNVGHVVEGLLLATVAVLALAQAFGHLKTGWARFLWPGLLLVAGLFLPSLIFIHPTVSEALAHLRVIVADPQQQQHIAMAILLFCSGAAEIIAARKNLNGLHMVWPLVLIVIGLLFGLHPQHGTGEAVQIATRIHRWLGIASIAAGLVRIVDVRSQGHARWARVAWPLLLLIAAVLLAAYREPPGSFERVPDEQRQHAERRPLFEATVAIAATSFHSRTRVRRWSHDRTYPSGRRCHRRTRTESL